MALERLTPFPARLTGWALAPDGGVNLQLSEENSGVWAWNPATDERARGQNPSVVLPNPGVIAAPAAILVETPVAIAFTAMAVSWSAVGSAYLAGYEIEFRPASVAIWQGYAGGFGATAVAIPTAEPTAFRVRAQARNGAVSGWCEALVLAAAAGLATTGITGGVRLSGGFPADAVRLQVFEASSASLASATKLAAEPSLTISLAVTAELEAVADRPRRERFKGFNDLTFAANGDLYFTDQGQTGLQDPTGRLWRLRQEKWLDLILDNIPSPNGLVLAEDDRILYLAVTRGNAVWRVPLRKDGGPGRVGIYIQISGGAAPDGMALDAKGGLVVAHLGMGSFWVFCPHGQPVAEITMPNGAMATNCAFGGGDGRTLFMTESQTGTILSAELDAPGAPLFSHA